MTFEEYQIAGRTKYSGLSEIVASIISAAVAKHPSLRAQQIQHRAKDIESLRKKLAKSGSPVGASVEDFVKDLAGVRIILYTNSDVGKFLSSSIIRDNFEIDWDRTKIHYPAAEPSEASELFDSNNYVVRLKDNRTSLAEYSDFTSLWCEVQVQTTLNHAWAEMAHDTIYKKPEVAGFGSNLMRGIEARMKGIMRRYLAPAGYAFQKVLSDFERLSEGKQLFEKGLISSLEACTNNNDLFDVIEKFSDLLPHYDDPLAMAEDTLVAMAQAVVRSREMPVQSIETPFGALDGKTSEEVASVAATVIDQLRYANIDKTFEVICYLYLGADAADEKAIWIKHAEILAEHNLDVWRESGPVVQSILVEKVRAKPEEEQAAILPLILAVLNKVLSVDIRGTSATSFDTITFHRGSVVPSDALKELRSGAIGLLVTYYAEAQEERQRGKIMSVLDEAMRLPSLQGSSPALAAIIFDDAAGIIELYTRSSDAWSFELRQRTEHALYWTYRHYGSRPVTAPADGPQEEARERLRRSISAFRDKLNEDQAFVTYKLLVGFESVFPPAWDDPEFDHEQEEAYRTEHVDRLVASVNEGNAADWFATIKRCAETQSSDLATFSTFNKFLEHLGTSVPAIVLGYMDNLDPRLANFLAPFLRGLSQTELWPAAQAKVEAWIASGSHLEDVAWSFASVEALSIDLLPKVLDAAIARADNRAVLFVLQSACYRANETNAPALVGPFKRAALHLSSKGELAWVRNWWGSKSSRDLILAMSRGDLIELLNSVVPYERVDNHLEGLLVLAAKLDAKLVIDFFGDRLEKREMEGRRAEYTAVPYSVGRLAKALKDEADYLIATARHWFDCHPEHFSYYGGKLVSAVFPSFPPAVQIALSGFIGTANDEDAEFVIAVLRAYSGQSFLLPMCKEIVALLPPDDERLEDIEIVLRQMGVTSGEFGHVEGLRNRRDEIAAWLEDERAPVQSFAQRYIKRLDSAIASEQRIAEERLALRKLEFDDPSDDAAPEPRTNDNPDDDCQ